MPPGRMSARTPADMTSKPDSSARWRICSSTSRAPAGHHRPTHRLASIDYAPTTAARRATAQVIVLETHGPGVNDLDPRLTVADPVGGQLPSSIHFNNSNNITAVVLRWMGSD